MPPANPESVHGTLARGLCLAACLLVAGCAPFSQSTPSSGAGSSSSYSHSGGDCKRHDAGSSYVVFGNRYYVLKTAAGYDERGIASWYGRNFHGKLTSSGVPYDMYARTAASKVLPLCTWVKVTNLENGRYAVVQINDRGPFVANRIIDLSYAAAKSLGMMRQGTALVNVRTIAGPSSAPPGNLEQISHETPTPTLTHGARIYLQLGAFVHRSYAVKLRSKLVRQNAGQVRIQTAWVHGRKFYRVQVGPYSTVAAIDRLADRLARLGYHDTDVVIE